MRYLLPAICLVLLPLAGAHAQEAEPHVTRGSTDTAVARFVTEARVGTARYRDRSVAIADGYHQVGPALPAMGEHWLNIGLVLADSIDAAHPPVLIYVESPNGPVLAGAAYTRLLGPSDSYPDFPRGLHAWHDHSGFVDDEALPMTHVRHATVQATERTRLGILHLWMGSANPAGEWTPDNWALPFVRAGVRAPTQSDAAARALVLAADSGSYYLDVLGRVARLDSSGLSRVHAALADASANVSEMRLRPGQELSAGDLARLSEIWSALGARLRQELSAQQLKDLSELWW